MSADDAVRRAAGAPGVLLSPENDAVTWNRATEIVVRATHPSGTAPGVALGQGAWGRGPFRCLDGRNGAVASPRPAGSLSGYRETPSASLARSTREDAKTMTETM